MREMKEREFPAGAVARCNRCDQRFSLPRTCKAVLEHEVVWRLQDMCTLACGHMDAYWVYDADNQSEELADEELGKVGPADACPRCDERRMDYLMWDCRRDLVTCASCGHSHQPGAR